MACTRKSLNPSMVNRFDPIPEILAPIRRAYHRAAVNRVRMQRYRSLLCLLRARLPSPNWLFLSRMPHPEVGKHLGDVGSPRCKSDFLAIIGKISTQLKSFKMRVDSSSANLISPRSWDVSFTESVWWTNQHNRPSDFSTVSFKSSDLR